MNGDDIAGSGRLLSVMAGLRAFDDEARPVAQLGPYALTGFLTRSAAIDPERIAVQDQPLRERWSGRATRPLSFIRAVELVERFSSYLAGLGLPPGARVGIALPGSSEFYLSLLAVESAGLVPCLLDLSQPATHLARSIEGAEVRVLITQAAIGTELVASKLCLVAASFFRLRFVLSFGPDVPDGVIDLDEVLAEGGEPVRPGQRASPPDDVALVTFPRHGNRTSPILRSGSALVACAIPIASTIAAKPGERILSCVAPDDLKGLATGPLPSLLTGVLYEGHGLFESAALLAALRQPIGTHLVVPGWMEPVLAAEPSPEHLRSITFVHDAPMRFGPGLPMPVRTIDVVAFGETALVVSTRGGDGRFTLRLDSRNGAEAISALLDVRCDENQEILFKGPAAQARSVNDPEVETDGGWRGSGFRTEHLRDNLVGIAATET